MRKSRRRRRRHQRGPKKKGGGNLAKTYRAQVGALDRAQVLLVGLGVARVLVEHVRVARLDLRLEDRKPQLLRLDRLLGAPLLLVALVQLVKLLAPDLGEPGALRGAHQRPVPALLDAAHEQVVGPQAVEQVARARLLLAVVLSQVEEVEDVGVPRLEVDGERALALAAALVDVARRVVEDAQHRHDAVGGAVGAADVRPDRADVVDRQADPARRLGHARALLQGVVDPLDRVRLHRDEEARRQLRARGPGVEQRRGRVREPALRQEVVGLDRAREVAAVDADRHAHQHVLRPLDDAAVDAEQVGALEGLEAEVVVVEVAVVDDLGVELLGVLLRWFFGGYGFFFFFEKKLIFISLL